MNIEIANRLYELRKKSGLSQEELAEKLNISRQSVSKWERAEASPDTDNLILLAKLYGVSLDELLMGDTKGGADSQDAEGPAGTKAGTSSEAAGDSSAEGKKNTHVHIGLDGIHVEDEEDTVHVTWKGVHIEENGRETVHVGKDGVRIEGDNVKCDGRTVIINDKPVCAGHHKEDIWHIIPVPLLCLVAFLVLGIVLKAWGTAWIVFLLVPIYYSLGAAIRKHDARAFAFPVLVVAVYLLMGFFLKLWHPGWIVFLTIPLYYSIAQACRSAYQRKHPNEIIIEACDEDDDDDDDDDD